MRITNAADAVNWTRAMCARASQLLLGHRAPSTGQSTEQDGAQARPDDLHPLRGIAVRLLGRRR